MLQLPIPLTDTKTYGTYNVSLCATYFLAQGYRVLFPYGDSGHYDLAIEKDGLFQRVQCKWTSHVKKPQGYPLVSLTVWGSPRRSEEAKSVVAISHTYTIKDFDLLWVGTPQTCYLIPFQDILNDRDTKNDLKLYPRWDIYRVAIPTPFPSDESTIKRASPRLTEQDKATIKRLHKEGRSQQQIADILCVTRSCVEAYLRRNNLK